jgi:hypothetical protein
MATACRSGWASARYSRPSKGSNNLFIEPQWSVADDGAGWPEWQVFIGFNMIFQ